MLQFYRFFVEEIDDIHNLWENALQPEICRGAILKDYLDKVRISFEVFLEVESLAQNPLGSEHRTDDGCNSAIVTDKGALARLEVGKVANVEVFHVINSLLGRFVLKKVINNELRKIRIRHIEKGILEKGDNLINLEIVWLVYLDRARFFGYSAPGTRDLSSQDEFYVVEIILEEDILERVHERLELLPVVFEELGERARQLAVPCQFGKRCNKVVIEPHDAAG